MLLDVDPPLVEEEEEEEIDGEESILRMSLNPLRSSSSGKICTKSDEESVRFAASAAAVSCALRPVLNLRQLSER